MKIDHLRSLGWRVLVIWQCELKDIDKLTTRLDKHMGEPV